jgi:hypothetical protein
MKLRREEALSMVGAIIHATRQPVVSRFDGATVASALYSLSARLSPMISANGRLHQKTEAGSGTWAAHGEKRSERNGIIVYRIENRENMSFNDLPV